MSFLKRTMTSIGIRQKMMMNEYEVFKLKWLADHGFTLKDAFIAAANYSKENVSLLLGDPEQSFDIWESERGFEGMIYPCEREWQDEWDDLDEPPQCIDLEII